MVTLMRGHAPSYASAAMADPAAATRENEQREGAPRRTVRDAFYDVLRERGMTTIFANPGSTEVSLLAGMPDDIAFVLALHEGSAVGMATGLAIARGEPSLVVLHTTAGLGNAVSALATARANRTPLLVVIGQQDRRHLAAEPFLAGKLHGLGGEYPVSVEQPVRPQDVPGAVARAYHHAGTALGPALVIVPMDDWVAPAGEDHEAGAPARLLRSHGVDEDAVNVLAALLADAESPALVVGAGADAPDGWAAIVALAERLNCPVFQEAFGARAGFPQDHPLFAGHLPAGRARLRDTLAGHDVVLAIGAPVFRQYPYEPGPFVVEGTRVGIVTDDPAEAHRSPADLAVLGPPAQICAALAEQVTAGAGEPPRPHEAADPPPPPGPGERLRGGHVLAALGERLPPEAVVVEEAPSVKPELHERIPIRSPGGFATPAMGGLGFALPASIGLRMGYPDRPVVAIVGDGSSLYQIQALWSATQYRVGALFVILQNGGYAIMDRLVERTGKDGPWPSFTVDIAAMARAQGCPAIRIEDHDELVRTLDEVIPSLAQRQEPLVLEVVVEPDPTFAG
jgi:benzoylformate decarboxylase